MDSDLTKKYYKIGEVSEILDIPVSTLRFWENRFTVIKPHRNAAGTRFYTPADIEKIRLIYYLVKQKGLKLEAAQEQIRSNRDGLERKSEVIGRLQSIRATIQGMLDSLDQRRRQ